jgi:hypothetical protein
MIRRREILWGGAAVGVVVAGMLLSRYYRPPLEEPLLDLSTADGHAAVGGFHVAINVVPRPPHALEALSFVLRFSRGVERVHLSFAMRMDMGPHEYELIPGSEGLWRADEVILPRCQSGSRLWFGTLTFVADGEEHRTRFRLELAEGTP